MITAERKPMEELIECIRPYSRIILAGCNECVTVCAAGGRKEVGILSSALQMAFMQSGKTLEIKEITLERQCDPEYVAELAPHVDQAEAVLSMACVTVMSGLPEPAAASSPVFWSALTFIPQSQTRSLTVSVHSTASPFSM